MNTHQLKVKVSRTDEPKIEKIAKKGTGQGPTADSSPHTRQIQLTTLTIIDIGDLVLEVDQGGEVVDAVGPGCVLVVRLDKVDAPVVALVVNVLQLLQGRLAVLVVLLVWEKQA